jgi:hypothetical protein
MNILENISNLIVLIEEEYYDGSTFWDRHKGKILGGAALLGTGVLAHKGVLGTGAQRFFNTNMTMAGQGLRTLSDKAKVIGSNYSPIKGPINKDQVMKQLQTMNMKDVMRKTPIEIINNSK